MVYWGVDIWSGGRVFPHGFYCYLFDLLKIAIFWKGLRIGIYDNILFYLYRQRDHILEGIEGNYLWVELLRICLERGIDGLQIIVDLQQSIHCQHFLTVYPTGHCLHSNPPLLFHIFIHMVISLKFLCPSATFFLSPSSKSPLSFFTIYPPSVGKNLCTGQAAVRLNPSLYQITINKSHQHKMGNVADKISQHKYELSLGVLGISWLAFLKYLHDQNKELRRIASSIDPEIPSMSKMFLEAPSTLSLESICSQFVRYKKNPIYRIALTGGPCAGKSTALQSIEKHFTKSGFKVFLVPQVPTIVGVAGGLSDFPKYNTRDLIQFQTDIIKFKIYFEDYITRLAEMSKCPCLILCDRGIADCAAYMSKESYQAVLDQEGWTWSGVRDQRYDSVIFMNTAADGAEEYYTLANNSARHETAEQARALDKRTLNAWIGHPYMTICPNTRGKPFKYKVDLAIKAVQKTIGLESTDIIYHKLLVEVDAIPQTIEKIESEIQEIYLRNQNSRFVQDKIKKRGQDKSFTYQRKFVGPYNPDEEFREVVRVSLNSLQYATLQQEQSDPFFRPIRIKRVNFSWNNAYFSLDRHDYIKDHKDAVLLRFQAGVGMDPLPLIPPWVRVVEDVRSRPEFALSSIARKQY